MQNALDEEEEADPRYVEEFLLALCESGESKESSERVWLDFGGKYGMAMMFRCYNEFVNKYQ